MLTRKSLSVFEAVGGWRTVAEGVASRVVFLIAYLLTGRVWPAALIAVAGVAVLAAARAWTERRYWSAAIGLAIVGGSAVLAGATGQAINFYLPAVVIQAAQGAVFLLSMVIGWPLVGVVLGLVRRERFAWRRDSQARRRYQLCTAVFVTKCVIATAVQMPLYVAGQTTALAVAATLLGGAPSAGACLYVCWRVLRYKPQTV
ncbi:DUF3159 domain-containing protein [Amycolatopsis sp. OK19-0408]|uniref:DUF3159 domain-containing protein n=1 Tax=Amycolatopsis iheyensis TaxID=2945988 RepID=A0A9X2NNZ6_9PSEU|nr:DUF3159 domain-containing protein [Amycolatopsis iheyensis]MCR6488715.1 DUF3159 domain-containing protein [Amycolatopsis iheyensis]